MRGIHFTLNGRTNQYPRLLDEDRDPKLLEEWVLKQTEFAQNRIAIVVERPGTEEAHMHCLVEAGQDLFKTSKPSEGLKRWMKDKYQELPKDWKAGPSGTSFHAKPLVGTQTMEETFGGYLQKESNFVAFQKGWDEEELRIGKASYAVKARKKVEDLYETTYMQKALAYAKATDYSGDDLWEVLADMDANGFSVAPLLAKRKISSDAVMYFSKKLRGGLSPAELRELLGSADAQERPIPEMSFLGPAIETVLKRKSQV